MTASTAAHRAGRRRSALAMHLLLSTLLTALPSTTHLAAQQPEPFPVGTPALATAGAFIGISVPDLDASVRWYVEKLGMRVIMEPPPSDGFTVKVVEGGGLIVELLHNAAAAPLRTAAPSITHTTQVHGVFKAGVVVEEYERTLATLRSRGVDIAVGPFPARAGQPANFIVRDNAGNLLQFFGR
jgi:catechol 2,3-dioxygenase-like lactoylglutathione lyase family enzyme